MAGSYNHATDASGRLRNWRRMTIATETQGDAYETIEEMYGMIWWLAKGNRLMVEEARANYRQGIEQFSPGVEPDDVRYEDDSDD
jgi:hypothetical protein